MEAAVAGAVGQTEGLDRARPVALVGTEVVERHRLAAQVGARDAHEPFQLADRCGCHAEMGQRRIAAPDPEVGPTARCHMHAGDSRRCRRRMTSRRIRHARAQVQVRGLASGEGQADEGVAGEVLRVDDDHAVEPLRLGPGRCMRGDGHV